jgi:prepilin-type N-terminal cleavage/methylation domain-containing protein
MKRSMRAFTIIELLVSITIIGILASISIVSYSNWQTSVISAQLKSDLNGVASAMENARTFGNVYPLSIPATFKPSQNVTLAGGSIDSGKTYCIDASSSKISLTFHIDQSIEHQGAQSGTCSSRLVPVLQATATSSSTIDLSWTSVPGAVNYTVQRDTDSSDTDFSSSVVVSDQPGTSVTSTGLTPGTTYYYRVGVTVSTGLWSVTKSATTVIPAPTAPVVAAATAGSTTTWSWNAAVCTSGTTARYQYDYTITPGFDSGWVNNNGATALPPYTTSTAGRSYTVNVQAQCYIGVSNSPWSASGAATYTNYGNAIASNILSGYTATTNSGLVTGSMTNMAAYNSSVSNAVSGGILYTRLSPGAYLTNTGSGYPEITSSVPDLVPANILSGKTILGVAGSMPNYSGGVHILAGNTVGDYDGEGYNSVYLQPPAGYYDGASWVRSRVPTLIASNIKSGVNIMGIVGTIPSSVTIAAGSNVVYSDYSYSRYLSNTWQPMSGSYTMHASGVITAVIDYSAVWSSMGISINIMKNGSYVAGGNGAGGYMYTNSLSINVPITAGDILTVQAYSNASSMGFATYYGVGFSMGSAGIVN